MRLGPRFDGLVLNVPMYIEDKSSAKINKNLK